ncbi:MAG: AbrB/MazE/SpoVT family DNA-binding domain-containing protein [Aquisalinus sp.]|nr:AbrB/MazE/SpoVT family DNA-binding domain-containing protein [Aquisalinus sp.]
MQVSKWGNSLAIRLPASIVKLLDLKEGDEVNITVAGERELGVDKKPSIEERLEKLRRFEGSLPKDWKFDRDEANER